MTESQKTQLLEEYAGNGAKKLNGMCYSIFSKFGGLYQKDYDDFYSIGNMVLMRAVESYDESSGCSFSTFLFGCLQNKFKTEMTRRNRMKQIKSEDVVYFEEEIGDGLTLGDTLSSDENIEDALEEKTESYSQQVLDYLNSLSRKQRKLVSMLVENYSTDEICAELGITSKQYYDLMTDLKKFDHVKHLGSLVYGY